MMTLGMLWFDNSPKDSLAVKIGRAAAYYAKKYERKPDFAFVHPSMLEKAGEIEGLSVTVRPYRPVLPGYIWIGMAEATEGKA